MNEMYNSQLMGREHILSKDCWCKPSVTSYCGKDELFEQLAAIEHERWADWQKYMHSKLLHGDDILDEIKTFWIDYHDQAWGREELESLLKKIEMTLRQREDDCSLPKKLIDQWERQIATPYAELSEAEKNSDRDQVKRYWNLI